MKVDDEYKKQALDKIVGVSDRGREGLAAWADAFIDAHNRVPGGLTIEVGTRVGGSAFLWAVLLEAMYGTEKAPPLWTVDPYGSKPYVGGDVGQPQAPIYDTAMYQAMRSNLNVVPFHAHWLLTSVDFFTRLDGVSYWRPGGETMEVLNVVTGAPLSLPVGIERKAGVRSASFILLDGEHTADAIERDLYHASRWILPGGCIVVDNVDTDPKTLPMLVRATLNAPIGHYTFDAQNRWLVVQVP